MHTSNYTNNLPTNSTWEHRLVEALMQTGANTTHKVSMIIWRALDNFLANQIKRGIDGIVFSEQDINNISVKKWSWRYTWYQTFSYGDTIGQVETLGHSEVNWGALLGTVKVDMDTFPYVQVLEISEALSKEQKIYQLLTILKLVTIHWTVALHESSPIRIGSWMLGLLSAHGIHWKFDKNNWNETGIYIFSKE